MDIQTISQSKCFEGTQGYYSHFSRSTGTQMKFSVYVPPGDKKFPVLYWLSGLTCTEENFTVKAGVQRFASQYGIIVVAPDTSPRGAGVQGETDSWDLGVGAGFYVNATEGKWAKNYRMYDYVSEELPEVIAGSFPVNSAQSISGHSMGGHGALVIGLRTGRYRSLSAFAPISSPTRCAWGQKAFTAYLGSDSKSWEQYDASLLIEKTKRHFPTLVDQGDADSFLKVDLKPELLEDAARRANYPLQIRYRKGYDHSYFFVSTFIQEHIEFHAKHLYAI